MEKFYLNKEGMERFLSNLKNIFSLKSHSHTKSDISDLPKTIGTITGIKMNGTSKGTSGVVDLGTVLTSGKQTTTSTADGGSNVYTFSDNSTITVKNGSKGINGTNGTSAVWFTGTVVTGTSTTATAFTVSGSKAGDMYLNTSTYNVYKASASNSWVYVCNIKGANGTNATTTVVASATANGLMSSTDKKNLDLVNNPLATCSTGRATAAKVATLANYTLAIGKPIAVKFTDTAGTANPTSGNLTLNVNGTGAKNIGYFRNGSKAALTYASGWAFYNNATHIFVYDGSYWLCLDWNADNNTTYSNFVKSGSGAKAGLVPAPSTTAGTTKYLREDGSWVVPPNTTYSKLSQFTNDKHYICEELSSSEPTDQSVGDYWVKDY